MSSDLLSQAEIDALLKGLDNGELDAPPPSVPGEVRAYDLTSEDRIARARLPALEMINERFARTWRVGVYNMLRRSVDLKILGLEIVKFGDYTNSLPAPTNLNMVQIKPLRGVALINLAPSLVFGVVDQYFGGDGKYPASAEGREFTPAELRIVQLLLKQTFQDLVDAWAPIQQIEPEYLRSEVNPHFANIINPREHIVVNRFSVTLNGTSGEFHIAYPYSMLDPIRESLDSGKSGLPSDQDDENWSEQLRERVKDAEVQLSCALAQRSITIRELSKLKVNDIIPINIQEQVTLRVENVPMFTGVFGIHNQNNAVKVTRINAQPAAIDPDSAEEILQ